MLFLFSLIISSKNRKGNYFKEKQNFIFIISSILLIFTTLLSSLNNLNSGLEKFDPKLTWIGLLNWIPFFYCLWGFQPYLKTTKSRRNTIKYLVCGSIPLIITGLGQYWFNWYGPFKFLNGLIIWFQRPLTDGDGLTGLFNNANYAGLWLTMIFPFIITPLLTQKNRARRNFLNLLIGSLFLISIYLTKSRNSLLGTILSSQILILNKYFLIITFFLILILVFLILVANLSIFPDNLRILAVNLLPNYLLDQFKDISFHIEAYPRLIIIRDTLGFILERPLIGWGSATFQLLYYSKHNVWYGHTHNIVLELILNYGILSASFILFGIISITIKSFQEINILQKFDNEISKVDPYDRAWFISFSVILFSQLFDIQYYDFRISMIFWILLSGLSCTYKYKKLT